MGQERDPELQDYLRGNSEVSRAYRCLNSLPPPPEQVDERILSLARQEPAEAAHSPRVVAGEMPRRPAWFAPFALTATVVLSVALVLAVLLEPVKQRRSDDAPRWIYAAARKSDALILRDSSLPVQRRSYVNGRPDAQPLDPQSWLMRIHELRREGRNLEADAEYRRFRAAFPDYVDGNEDEAAN